MKKIFLTLIVFLFMISAAFAVTISANQQQTMTLTAGNVLTVAAPSGTTGLVVRMSRTPGGGSSQSVTAINGATLYFGPYADVERFNIICTAGTVTLTEGSRLPYASTITNGDDTHSPTNNAVYDALALKADVAGPTFTGTVTIPTADINGGTIDSTTIGGTVPAAGAFTTLSASTSITISEKTPVNAVASSKLLTIGTAPVEAATVSIGGVTYKFRAVLGAGVKATATLTSDETEVVDGDTVTVNDITYRFKDTMAQANDVQRNGTTPDTTLANLVAAINLSGTEGVEYFAGTSAATGVVAAAVSSHATVITADDIGFAGNAFAKAENSIHLDFDGEGAYFTGGVDAQAANDVLIGTIEESINNLVLAVTAGANEGTKYGTGTVVNPLATAVKASESTMTATNLIKGVIGDSTAVAETLADGSWAADATFLSGGIDATTCVANEIAADGSYLYHCVATGTTADQNWRRIGLGSAY